MVIWRSPSAARSTTARRLRPIGRWISTGRPPCLPPETSRRVRSRVARGSMPYSAVIQPRAWPLSQGGRRSSRVAVTRTWVSPKRTKQEPSAYFTTPRSSDTGRNSSGCRRLGRMHVSLGARLGRSFGRKISMEIWSPDWPSLLGGRKGSDKGGKPPKCWAGNRRIASKATLPVAFGFGAFVLRLERTPASEHVCAPGSERSLEQSRSSGCRKPSGPCAAQRALARDFSHDRRELSGHRRARRIAQFGAHSADDPVAGVRAQRHVGPRAARPCLRAAHLGGPSAHGNRAA